MNELKLELYDVYYVSQEIYLIEYITNMVKLLCDNICNCVNINLECKKGKFISLLSHKFKYNIGIDQSIKNIKYCNYTNICDKTHFIQGDPIDIINFTEPLADNNITIVVTYNVIYIDNIFDTIKQISHIIEQNGLIIISFLNIKYFPNEDSKIKVVSPKTAKIVLKFLNLNVLDISEVGKLIMCTCI